MKHRFLQQVVLVLSATILLFSCSQNENPTSVPNSSSMTLSKATYYSAAHSSYNNATSFISGTVTGLQNGLSGSNKTITLNGFIAGKVRSFLQGAPGAGSDPLTLTGYISIGQYNWGIQWFFTFNWPQNNQGLLHKLAVGTITSSYHGVLTGGTYPAPATIVFETNPFSLGYVYRNQQINLWSYSSWANSNESVSFVINTSLQ